MVKDRPIRLRKDENGELFIMVGKKKIFVKDIPKDKLKILLENGKFPVRKRKQKIPRKEVNKIFENHVKVIVNEKNKQGRTRTTKKQKQESKVATASSSSSSHAQPHVQPHVQEQPLMYKANDQMMNLIKSLAKKFEERSKAEPAKKKQISNQIESLESTIVEGVKNVSRAQKNINEILSSKIVEHESYEDMNEPEKTLEPATIKKKQEVREVREVKSLQGMRRIPLERVKDSHSLPIVLSRKPENMVRIKSDLKNLFIKQETKKLLNEMMDKAEQNYKIDKEKNDYIDKKINEKMDKLEERVKKYNEEHKDELPKIIIEKIADIKAESPKEFAEKAKDEIDKTFSTIKHDEAETTVSEAMSILNMGSAISALNISKSTIPDTQKADELNKIQKESYDKRFNIEAQVKRNITYLKKKKDTPNYKMFKQELPRIKKMYVDDLINNMDNDQNIELVSKMLGKEKYREEIKNIKKSEDRKKKRNEILRESTPNDILVALDSDYDLEDEEEIIKNMLEYSKTTQNKELKEELKVLTKSLGKIKINQLNTLNMLDDPEKEKELESIISKDIEIKRETTKKKNIVKLPDVKEEEEQQPEEENILEEVPPEEHKHEHEHDEEGAGYGKGILSDDIDKLLKHYPHYFGVVDENTIREAIKKINRGKPNMFSMIYYQKNEEYPEGHFCAIFCDVYDDKTFEYYNSFGEDDLPGPIYDMFVSTFEDRYDLKHMLKYKYNEVKQQPNTSSNCGLYAAKFITERYYGVPFKEATEYDSKLDGELDKARQNFGFI